MINRSIPMKHQIFPTMDSGKCMYLQHVKNFNPQFHKPVNISDAQSHPIQITLAILNLNPGISLFSGCWVVFIVGRVLLQVKILFRKANHIKKPFSMGGSLCSSVCFCPTKRIPAVLDWKKSLHPKYTVNILLREEKSGQLLWNKI